MNIISEALTTLPGNWCQGRLEDNQGNMCVMGHLNRSIAGLDYYSDFSRSHREYCKTYAVIKEVGREQFPERWTKAMDMSLTIFNDHPDTTEEDVILVMEKAAIKMEEL